MRGGWKCASTMSGGQCAMSLGMVPMPQWSASNWDMQPLEVSSLLDCFILDCNSSDVNLIPGFRHHGFRKGVLTGLTQFSKKFYCKDIFSSDSQKFSPVKATHYTVSFCMLTLCVCMPHC